MDEDMNREDLEREEAEDLEENETPEEQKETEETEAPEEPEEQEEADGDFSDAQEKIDSFVSGKDQAQNSFLKPIAEYLAHRAQEDQGFAQDILREGKTAAGMMRYLKDAARKYATGNCVAVPDSVVYEWAEDYIRSEEKEPKAKVKLQAETQKPAKKRAPKPHLDKAEKPEKAKAQKKEPPEKPEKPKKEKKSGDLDGQLSLFDMMEL